MKKFEILIFITLTLTCFLCSATTPLRGFKLTLSIKSGEPSNDQSRLELVDGESGRWSLDPTDKKLNTEVWVTRADFNALRITLFFSYPIDIRFRNNVGTIEQLSLSQLTFTNRHHKDEDSSVRFTDVDSERLDYLLGDSYEFGINVGRFSIPVDEVISRYENGESYDLLNDSRDIPDLLFRVKQLTASLTLEELLLDQNSAPLFTGLDLRIVDIFEFDRENNTINIIEDSSSTAPNYQKIDVNDERISRFIEIRNSLRRLKRSMMPSIDFSEEEGRTEIVLRQPEVDFTNILDAYTGREAADERSCEKLLN